MEINSTGQVSSLIPEATRPNAPARVQPEAVVAAPAGGAPLGAPSAVVVDVAADHGAANDGADDGDGAEPAARDTPSSVDITV